MDHKKTLKETPEQLIRRILKEAKAEEGMLVNETADVSKQNTNEANVQPSSQAAVIKGRTSNESEEGQHHGTPEVETAEAQEKKHDNDVAQSATDDTDTTPNQGNQEVPETVPIAPDAQSTNAQESNTDVSQGKQELVSEKCSHESPPKKVFPKRKARIVKPEANATEKHQSTGFQTGKVGRRSTLYSHTKSSRKKMAFKLADQYEQLAQINEYNKVIAPSIRSRRISVPRETQMRNFLAAEKEAGTLQATRRRLLGRLSTIQNELDNYSNQKRLLIQKKQMQEHKLHRVSVAYKRDSEKYHADKNNAEERMKGVQQRMLQAFSKHKYNMITINNEGKDNIDSLKEKIEKLDLEIASSKERNESFMTDVQIKMVDVGKEQLAEQNLAMCLRVQKSQFLNVLKARGAIDLHNAYMEAMKC